MARYRGSKEKVIRRLNILSLPGLKNTKLPPKKLERRKKRRDRKDQYKRRMQEKQKLKYYYGLTERQMIRCFLNAKNAEGSTTARFIKNLEMRLDNIVFRFGFAPSIPAARQLVTHGHIYVNTKKMYTPSYVCKIGDTIKLMTELGKSSIHSAVTQQTRHLRMNETKDGGTVMAIAPRRLLPTKINDRLVIEFYSR